MSEIQIVCLWCCSTVSILRKKGARSQFCGASCRLQHRKKYYEKWWTENREDQLLKTAARIQAWARDNPDYFKTHYAANRERKKSQSRAWYAANKDRAQKRQKEYSAEHPELIKACSRKSRSKRRAIAKKVFVDYVDPQVVFARDNGICGICKKPVGASCWEIDHMIPISRGGAHAYVNVQLAHRACNRAKGAKLPVGQPSLFQVA